MENKRRRYTGRNREKEAVMISIIGLLLWLITLVAANMLLP